MRQRKEPERRHEVAAPAVGQVEEQGQSNDHARDALGGGSRDALGGASLDAVRDAAIPLVEGAHLAIQLHTRAADEQARLLDVLARSALPAERVAALTARLEEQQGLATEIASAIERWFGVDDAETRGMLSDALAAVAAAVAEGAPTADGWTVGERTLPWQGADASARAEALVPALAREIAGLDGRDADRLGGLCREVQLLAIFDEDEEEGLLADYAAEEHG